MLTSFNILYLVTVNVIYNIKNTKYNDKAKDF